MQRRISDNGRAGRMQIYGEKLSMRRKEKV